MSKYLDSKKGSIEELSTKIASEQPTIDRTFKSDVKLTDAGDIKKVVAGLKKATALHSKQADSLEKAMKSEKVMPDDKGEKINQAKVQKAKDGEKQIIKPIKEGRMKEIAIDMKDLSAEQFKTKYGESKAEMQKKLGKPENEKSFKDMRKEMNKTMTGKKIASVDTEPQSERI